jgi:ABC-type transport system substrate-binding protein
VAGHDEKLAGEMIKFDLERAKKLLAEAGYPNGIDPATGEPLEISFDQSGNSTRHRQQAEMTASDWGKLGIKVKINLNNAPRFYQKLRNGQMQTFRLSWVGDYPDAENFLQLFYSRNAGGANRAAFGDPVFDRMFEKTLPMADSPERTRLYREMARYLVKQSPWIFETQPLACQLKHAWLQNYYDHDFAFNRWKFCTVDNDLKNSLRKKFKPLSMRELRER